MEPDPKKFFHKISEGMHRCGYHSTNCLIAKISFLSRNLPLILARGMRVVLMSDLVKRNNVTRILAVWRIESLREEASTLEKGGMKGWRKIEIRCFDRISEGIRMCMLDTYTQQKNKPSSKMGLNSERFQLSSS
jgi:hypothetical protein